MKSLIKKLAPAMGLAFLVLVSGRVSAAGVVLVFGDSLSSAYGISQKDGWTSLLQSRLTKLGLDYTVVNQSIPGETTSGGATRIKTVVSQTRPKVAIIALGGNDGLRGLPVRQMRENLTLMVRAVQSAGGKVLLLGMKMPPNYGPGYTREFESAYVELARQLKVGLVPFMLEGMDHRRDLFQPDNIHPTEKAQPMILETVWKGLRPLL